MGRIWLFVALCAALSTTAHAQLELDRASRALAYDLARVAMNEAGTEADLALLWQVVSARGQTTQARHAWLRAHSPCVTGRLPLAAVARRPGLCRWTRHLAPRQYEAPHGFVNVAFWPRVRNRWHRLVVLALEHVAGTRTLIVCAETPTTWDGARWRADAERRGFEVLDCKGTRNLGLRRARATASVPTT